MANRKIKKAEKSGAGVFSLYGEVNARIDNKPKEAEK